MAATRRVLRAKVLQDVDERLVVDRGVSGDQHADRHALDQLHGFFGGIIDLPAMLDGAVRRENHAILNGNGNNDRQSETIIYEAT